MAIIEHILNGQELSEPKVQIGLNISVNIMNLMISAGNINGVAIPDTTITFVTPTKDRQVEVLLVRKISDGTGDVWIDNRLAGRDRANTPSGYEVIETLCWFILPANTTDLINIDINVRRII